MALQRKPATQAAAPEGADFGHLDFYTAGGGIPNGDYVWTELNVLMFQAQDKQGVNQGPERLGVQIKLRPLSDPSDANEKEQFYSMGSSAHKAWAPNSVTGKGIVPVPGGGGGLNNSTNWAMLLKSLYDCGLPVGVFTNDVGVLEGMHVHMNNVPEPEERKGFRAATGEAAVEQRARTVAIVSEILDSGKPWEGTGGVPETTAAKPNGKPTVPVKAAPKAGPKPVAKAAPAEEAGDLETNAQAAVSDVLGNHEKGCTRLLLRTSTFKAAKEAYGDDMAQAIIDTYFTNDESLNGLLGPLGFAVAGPQVKPA